MTNIAIENGPFTSWIYPIENGGSVHSHVSLPEGTSMTLETSKWLKKQLA